MSVAPLLQYSVVKVSIYKVHVLRTVRFEMKLYNNQRNAQEDFFISFTAPLEDWLKES
jgi:hypothetical protein